MVNGHDHDYERSFPVRGFDPTAGTEIATGQAVETTRPPGHHDRHGTFDTSQGTVHLVPGGRGLVGQARHLDGKAV